jgi:DNA-binding SARP family transcriptional activator/TolB-like protein
MATRIASRTASGGRQWRLSRAGRFALVHAGTSEDASPPTRKARAILAFLCLQPGQRFTRERIATLLWGDRGEAQARASLRQALLEIRHATADGPSLLQSDREHVWAEPTSLEPEALDETSWARSDELLFDDLNNITLDFDEWLAVARADRSRRLGDALRKEVEMLLDRDRGAAALPLVDRLHRLDPFDEDALRLALRAEYQAGRVAGIEQRVREMDSRLQDELGVTVSSESRALRDELIEALGTSTAEPKLPHSVEPALKHRGKALAARLGTEPKRHAGFSRTIKMSAAAAMAVVLLAIAAFFLVNRTAKAPTSAPSVALLPFTADSSDPDARKLAAATRDAVAHAVSQGSFSVSTIDGARQGGGAPADFLISGQISGTPDKFVITVRTEETAHHLVVGSDEFEASRQKAWELPERVGANVASGFAWIAPLFALERRHPDDPAIAASLLQSSSATLVSVDALHDYEKSRRLAAKAPNSPLAQYSLAFNTVWALGDLPREDRAEAVARARFAADRTLKLAPEFGAGYILECLLHSEQRRVQCEDSLRAGMRADPSDPFSPWFLSRLMSDVGRNEEALELARISVALDQYRSFRIGLMLRMLEVTGQTAEAEDLYRRSTRWFPGDYYIIWYRAGGMLLRGDFEATQRFQLEAGQQFKREILEGGGFQTHQPLAALTSALQSNSATRARRACARVTPEDDSALQCMLGLARVGDLDGAYRYADGVYASRRGRTPAEEERIWLDNPSPPAAAAYLTGPVAAPLRRDPRYVALAERVGLLEYWRSGRPPDFCRKNPEPICAQLLKGS